MKPFDSLSEGLRRWWEPSSAALMVQRLAQILDIEVNQLTSIRFGPRYHYRPFTITKRDGRERRLLAPSPTLKQLQRRLLDHYLKLLPTHHRALAFRSACSNATNARLHSFQRLIATVDLRDFFETTRVARVRGFFYQQGWRDEALKTLLRVCVYNDGLPQGAPTSPALSNLVNIPLDEALDELVRNTGGIYTRYADDLTFSWSNDRLPDGFQRASEEILRRFGYEVQPAKGWCVSPIEAHPIVTGIVLLGDGSIRLPWSTRWRGWKSRLRWWWSGDARAFAQWSGYKGYAMQVKSQYTGRGFRRWPQPTTNRAVPPRSAAPNEQEEIPF